MTNSLWRDGWRAGNIRRFARMRTGHTPSRTVPEYWENTSIPWFTLADVWQLRDGKQTYIGETRDTISDLGLANSAAELLPTGTVVLSRTASIGFSGIMSMPMATSQDFWNWTCGPELLPRYLNYQFKSMSHEFRALNMGSTHQTIYQKDAAGLRILVPPIDQQRAIADFLDRETAQIDTLIAKQEQLIELLGERRRVSAERLLGHRVGNGRRLKYYLREIDSRAQGLEMSLPLMSVSISWGVRRRDEVTDDVAKSIDLRNYKVCDPGDIAVNRMRAFQGALGVAPARGIVSPDYAVLRTESIVSPAWLAALMRTNVFVGEMISRLKGIGGTEGGSVRTPRINVSDLVDIAIVLPPLVEQNVQIAFMSSKEAHVRDLVMRAAEFIAFAKERRAALITAAVTGQIDVRRSA